MVSLRFWAILYSSIAIMRSPTVNDRIVSLGIANKPHRCTYEATYDVPQSFFPNPWGPVSLFV